MLARTQTKVAFSDPVWQRHAFLAKVWLLWDLAVPCTDTRGERNCQGRGGQERLCSKGGILFGCLQERQQHGCVLDKVPLLNPTLSQLHVWFFLCFWQRYNYSTSILLFGINKDCKKTTKCIVEITSLSQKARGGDRADRVSISQSFQTSSVPLDKLHKAGGCREICLGDHSVKRDHRVVLNADTIREHD